MKRKKSIFTAAILMAAVTLTAQNKSGGINLSVWKNVSTQPSDSTQTTYFNLGLSSYMNRLNGLGVNVLVGTVSRDMNGMQASGLANIVGGSMHGVQVSGISNINGNDMIGISATGLVNIAGNNAKGVILSGLTNIGGDRTAGLVASGLMNITGDGASGVQMSGMANITGATFDGVMMSGLLNVAGQNVNGIQIAGIANITSNRLNGIQIGLSNYATTANGLQIGLVNYYRSEMNGFQLGLINANPNTKIQLMAFGGNATKINVGVRFKNSTFYTIVGAGTHYLDFSDKFSASFFYRAGLGIPIYKGFSISGDLGYQHIETFKNRHYGIPARLYALQARANLEYQCTKQFGIFATGGYGLTRYYNKARNFDKGAIVEGGIYWSIFN